MIRPAQNTTCHELRPARRTCCANKW
jgi:hypothetical protein